MTCPHGSSTGTHMGSHLTGHKRKSLHSANIFSSFDKQSNEAFETFESVVIVADANGNVEDAGAFDEAVEDAEDADADADADDDAATEPTLPTHFFFSADFTPVVSPGSSDSSSRLRLAPLF